MKKILAAAAFAIATLAAVPAQADVVTGLHLNFASGASWDGTVTFTDGYGKMIDTNGTMTGGGFNGTSFTWTWWQGTNQTNPNAWDGNPATYEDILMGGADEPGYTAFIGISWFHGNPGDTPVLSLASNNAYWHSASNGDLIVSGAFGTVPEPGSLALGGLALFAAAAARRRRA